jgi:hypothetical protein
VNLYLWDLETFNNCYYFTGKFQGSNEHQVYEISERTNQRTEHLSWLSYLQNTGCHMVGFNSLNFDYPILHELLNNPYTFGYTTAYLMAQKIIGSQSYWQNPHAIRMSDRLIPQIDLVKVNHFDNPARRCSLKSLQFAMRSESVEDLPYDPNIPLTYDQMDNLRAYNLHDVTETEKFLGKCRSQINLRKELLDQGILSGDVLNFSDVKIGTEYLIRKIGRAKCFVKGSTPRQTQRQSVEFKNVILPKISFRTEPFEQVLDWFKSQTLWIGKEEKPKLEAKLAGLEFTFGLGGCHSSVENKRYVSTDTHVIKDIDVSGMYVAIAVANGFYPEHLGQDFTIAYKGLQTDRKQYAKGTVMNLVLKLAGNGVFGNSNNSFSPFYDPKYQLSVTLNGQLQLLQLVEVLSLIPGVEIIQANTDGITALVPRELEHFFNLWKSEWEIGTGLKLEEVEYSTVWQSDVNNFLAIDSKGNIKRKGRYWYPITEDDMHGGSGSNWNKDFSNMSAQKGIEQCLLTGIAPEDIVYLITDPFDFMLRYKTPSGSKVFIGEYEMSKTVRYYVSTEGQPMKKITPAKGVGFKRKAKLTDAYYDSILATIQDGAWDSRIHTKNKSVYEETTTSIESGRLVRCCNHADDFNWRDVDFDFYAKEIRKLLI